MPVTEISRAQRVAPAPRPSRASSVCGSPPAHARDRSRRAAQHRPRALSAGSRTAHGGHHYAAHLGHPPLRTADGHNRDERRTSWLELFFDLAFAGAVGQLAGALQDHPSLSTLARFALLFTPIWWLWVQLSFYADRHESEDAAHRVPFLAAILLCVGLAASAPRALSGSTTGFVIAFACLRGLQLLLYARARHHLPATRPLYNCYLVCFGAGGALWLSSLAVGGSARYAFWGVALLADVAGSMAMLTPRRRVPVNTAHLTDRFQLFVLIVLGESMARLISAAAIRPWSLPLATVLGAALLTLAALWWAWLTAADRQALDGLPAVARFTALNLPLVAGVAAGSAGLHLAILAADRAGTIAAGPRAALYGGVSVFLLASAILPSRKMTRPVRVARLATATASMGLVFMGAIVEPVYLVPALTVILALGLWAETRPAFLSALPVLPWRGRPAPELPAALLQPVPGGAGGRLGGTGQLDGAAAEAIRGQAGVPGHLGSDGAEYAHMTMT